MVDSVVVRWNDGRAQTLKNVKADQVVTVDQVDAVLRGAIGRPVTADSALFREITRAAGVTYRHHDYDFIDFDIQHLLPHKLTEYCPALAAGDLDGNGLDDLVIGGNGVYATHVLLQQADGRFVQKDSLPGTTSHSKVAKDEGILLFDANGDGYPDIYIASGGYELAPGSAGYGDRLYINDGKGHFQTDSLALPENYTSKFCVRAMDYNQDGKLDLFVAGRVDPWNYPRPVSSIILRNDTENGKVKFTDVTADVAPVLKDLGMVCDALCTDFDGDGLVDLIAVGEWMPVTFLKNKGGKFSNVTERTGVGRMSGWWNSIAAGDFRHTGRTDYIIGNVGLNTLYQASDQYPVYMTAGDFAGSGRTIGVASLFLPDRNGVRREFPAAGRDDIARVMPQIKKRYPTYGPYASATMDELVGPEQRKGALRLKANMLRSCYLRNEGGGKFTMIPLPNIAQISTINGMVVDDVDGDGNLDVMINGNDFGTSIGIGRYDAFNGLVMKGDGAGGFRPLSMLQSGVCIPGNGRALVRMRGASDGYLLAASQNKNDLKLYRLNRKVVTVPVMTDDVSAMIRYRNGKGEKRELYYGSSFLSQSARGIVVGENVMSVDITNTRDETRTVKLDSR